MIFLLVLTVCLGVAQVKAQCESTLTTVSGSRAPTGPLCKAQLLFEDNFDEFDEGKWSYQSTNTPANEEFEYYTDRCCVNSFVENGVLNVKPSLTEGRPDLSPVQSARLVTRDSFNFKYGYLEISAKSPTGDWLWPALWMMPKDSVYGGWPRSGELDILETRGNVNYHQNNNQIGSAFMESTLHWGPDSNNNQYSRTHFSHVNTSTPYNNAFHKYGVEWTPDHIMWIVDDTFLGMIQPPAGGFWELGQLSGSNIWSSGSRMAPFDQEFYFIFNVAIGGWYFPDNADGVRKPWTQGSSDARNQFWNARDQWLPTWHLETNSAALQVDYVRVWAL